MALLLALLFWLVAASEFQTRAVDRDQAVIASAEKIQNRIEEGDTALRALEVTHDTTFWKNFGASRGQLPGLFVQLRGLLKNDSAQSERLKQLGQDYEAWLKLTGNNPVMKQGGATTLTLSRSLAMSQIQGVLDQLMRAEHGNLDMSVQGQRRSAIVLLAVFGGSIVLLGALLLFQSYRTMTELSLQYEHNLHLLKAQTAELKASHDELDKRVEERTHELNAVNRELEIFCYSAAHDLRAPLRWIIATNRMFQEDYGQQVPEEGIKELGRVNMAATRLSNLIDALLEMARLGKVEIKKSQVNLSALCELAITEIRERDWGGPVEVEIQPNLQLLGDPLLLSLLLQNLLENAFKFSARSGHGRVEVSGYLDGDEMTVSVKDNGVGFDSSCSGKLFQPLERLHSDEEFAGTGMGLANAKRIVDRHGGRIWAEGEPGKGATFSFSLPC
ncbi:MAG TPA: ATP-binding protein [Fimbriimonadaceae bacterium]|jgi:signal transduction histidine kinase